MQYYISFICTAWWVNIWLPWEMITTVNLVIICNHKKLMQYFWLCSPCLVGEMEDEEGITQLSSLLPVSKDGALVIWGPFLRIALSCNGCDVNDLSRILAPPVGSHLRCLPETWLFTEVSKKSSRHKQWPFLKPLLSYHLSSIAGFSLAYFSLESHCFFTCIIPSAAGPYTTFAQVFLYSPW